MTDTEGLKPIEVDFALPRGVVVRGRLVDKADGRLVPNEHVLHIKAPDNLEPGDSNDTHSYTPGKGFTLTVPAGRGMLLASVKGDDVPYIRARLAPADKGKGIGGREDGEDTSTVMDAYHAYRFIEVPADVESIDITLEVTRGGTLEGRLVDDAGKPVIGAQAYGLRANWAVRTLDDARFEATGLEPGRERLLAFSHRGRKLAGSAIVKPGGGPIEVKLLPCGSASGRLVDEDGLPMAGIKLRLAPLGQDDQTLPLNSGFWPEGESVTTDPDGKFRFEGINPTLGLGLMVTVKARPGTYLTTDGKLDKLHAGPGQALDLGDVRARFVPK